eukprot:Lithocolla_globosa_v1_NODE_47_length_7891_cov_8.351582.p6 type:complete len:121 gc:universal NODE_47_length_7891_cov_8.351582:7438-7800(+)
MLIYSTCLDQNFFTYLYFRPFNHITLFGITLFAEDLPQTIILFYTMFKFENYSALLITSCVTCILSILTKGLVLIFGFEEKGEGKINERQKESLVLSQVSLPELPKNDSTKESDSVRLTI